MSESTASPVRILLVDDTPTNLAVLSESIQHQGWTTLFATDGETAIEQAEYALPDVILLDVMMPGIDGFETCSRLKANPTTASIPIIFMTALSDSTDRVRGLKLGAVDYITKPFQQEEVVTRVGLQIRLYRMRRELEANNLLLNKKIAQQAQTEAELQALTHTLEQRVATRTAELASTLDTLQKAQMQLVQSEKMSSLGQMMAGIAHEINNPVNFIYGNIRPAEDYFKDLISLVEHYQDCYPTPPADLQEHLEDLDVEFMVEDTTKLLSSLRMGADRIRQIVLSLRNFSRLDESDFKPVNIHEGIDSTLLILQNKLKRPTGQPIEIIKAYGDEFPLVECYPSQINQVFMNILANAADAFDEAIERGTLPANFRPEITISTVQDSPETATITISDNGMGIPEEIQNKLFDPFFTTKPVGKGTGLGLSISYEIVVKKHGGSIRCQSLPGQGTQFVITIPLKQSVAEPGTIAEPESEVDAPAFDER